MNNDAARAIACLRDQGRRLTTARRMVIEGLSQTSEHVTAEILAGWIQHVRPEIHLSTVYRTLDSLREWGLITQVRRPHGAAFFHLSPTHQHVVCEVCGRIEDVPSSEFEDLVDRLRDRHDFDLDVRHTALVGRCRQHGRSQNGGPAPNGAHPGPRGTTTGGRRGGCDLHHDAVSTLVGADVQVAVLTLDDCDCERSDPEAPLPAGNERRS